MEAVKIEKDVEKLGIVKDKAQIIDVKRALDAYSNAAANLGAGAKNLVESGTYIMQRLSWDYMTLNTLFRDNWIAKAIIEKPANEMMKNGFSIQTQLDPDKITLIQKKWKDTTREDFLNCLKWSRLYGGCLLIPLIEGQDNLEEPLDYDTIGIDDYKGCIVIDRWCGVSPSLELEDDINDTEYGLPKYYTISSDKLQKTVKIHHTRVIRMIGRKLPYWQEITENYWGASELEHVFNILRTYDTTTANMSFLIFLANIRTLKIKDLGSMISIGDQEALQQVYKTVQSINELMCSSGILAIDNEGDLKMQSYTFTGLSDVYNAFRHDIAGASEIPVDKLFGKSPTGFNTGEETLQNYYDMIQEKQESYLRFPLERIIKIICISTVGELPDDFELVFNPINQTTDKEKADLSTALTTPLLEMYNAGIIDRGTVLRELKQQTSITGMWTNITDDMIAQADEDDERQSEEENLAQAEMQEKLESMLSERDKGESKA